MNKRVPVSMAVAVLLSACSITPDAIQTKDFLAQAKEDAARMRDGVDEVKDLTLDEALARALKFNLDRRVKMMEEALAFNQLDMTKLDMLPRLALQAGYFSRDNDRISRSRTPEGLPSSSTFISSDRHHETQDLTLSWSLLDFGLGYYNSQQQADRVLIAAEKRRKAMHILLQDVRTAFWRSVSAQKLQAQVRQITKEAEDALADSRKAETERIRGPLDSLRYQRQILENLRLLEAIDQELSAAQVELSALINAPVGQKMRLVEPNVKPEVKSLDIAVEQMEEMALSENPDLREQNYNHRIASVETRKTLLRLFPNLTLTYGPKYDSDSYQVNNRWSEAGAQVSYNLFNIFTLETQKKLAEAGVSLADQRRMAVQMAVVTQVHLARQQFANSLSQLNRAEDIWKTDEKIADLMVKREVAQVQSKLDRVSNQTAAVLSKLRRYQAVSAVYAAEARLNATLGVEPRVDSVLALDLPSLTKVVARGGSVTAAHQFKMALNKMQDEVKLSETIVATSEDALKEAQDQLKKSEDRLKIALEALEKARTAEANALDKAAAAARRKAEVESDMASRLEKAQDLVQEATDQRVASQSMLDQKTVEVGFLTEGRDKAAAESQALQQAYKEAETKAAQDLTNAKTAVNNADKVVDDQKLAVRESEKQLDRSTSDLERAQRQLLDAQQKVKTALATQAKLKDRALALESSKSKRAEQETRVTQLTQSLADGQKEQAQMEQQYKAALQARDAADVKADEDVKLARQAFRDAKTARDAASANARAAQKLVEQSKDDQMARKQLEDANATLQQAQANVTAKDQAIDDAKNSGKAAYQAAREAAKLADTKLEAQNDQVKQLSRELDRAKRDLDDLTAQITKNERELEKDMTANAQELQLAQNQESVQQQQVNAQNAATEAARANLIATRAALDEAQKNLANAKVARETSQEQGLIQVRSAKEAMQQAQSRHDAAERSLKNAQSDLRDAQRADDRAVELASRATEKLQSTEIEVNERLEKAEAAKAPHDLKAQAATQSLQATAQAQEEANAAFNQAAQLRERRTRELEAAKLRNQNAIDALEKAPKTLEEIWSKDVTQSPQAAFLQIKNQVEAMK